MICRKNHLLALLVALLLVVGAGTAGAKEACLRLLHVNDFHGYAQPHQPAGAKEPLGGAAYLARQVAELRSQAPTLLLAAGDMVQGNSWANLFQGASVIDLMNAMQFDAMVVGNHEFEYGREVLEKLIREARFPVLGANVRGVTGLKAYAVKTQGGLQVGLIGVVTPETAHWVHPRHVEGLAFSAPEEAVRQVVEQLRGQVDLIVVLSHLGYDADRRLASQVKGIDIIIGGHSHTKLPRPEMLNGVIIAQAYEHGKSLGVLDLTWRDGKIVHWDGHLVEIKPVPGRAEAEIEKLVARYQQRLDAFLGEQVGRTETLLNGENEQVRTRETTLGNLVADVVRARAGADAALINGGSLKKSIAPGVILRQDVYDALPYDSYVVALRLTGRELQEALEHGVSAVEQKAGRFPQVSGLTFAFDPKAPPGARVQEVLVGGKPLVPEQKYTVATYDFLAVGGDGYAVLGRALGGAQGRVPVEGMLKNPKVVFCDPGRFVRDEVVDYLKARPLVAPKLEGRIRARE